MTSYSTALRAFRGYLATHGDLSSFQNDPLTDKFRAEGDPDYTAYYDEYTRLQLAIQKCFPPGTEFSQEQWDVMVAEARAAGHNIPMQPSSAAAIHPGVTCEDHSIDFADGTDHFKVRVYEPSARKPGLGPGPTGRGKSGVMVYYHGGGMLLGAAKDSEQNYISRVSETLGIPVVSVFYRLAPQHRFPAGHDDAYTAYEWARGAGSELLDIDPDAVLLGGSSSGGNLALSTLIRAVQASPNAHGLRGTIVSVPVCAADGIDDSQGDINCPMFPPGKMTCFERNYMSADTDLMNPRWNLVATNDEDLGGLGPITIMTAPHCPLTQNTLLLAERIGAQGGEVSLFEYDKMPHAAQSFDAVCKASQVGNTELVRAAARHLAQDTAGITREALYGDQLL